MKSSLDTLTLIFVLVGGDLSYLILRKVFAKYDLAQANELAILIAVLGCAIILFLRLKKGRDG